MVKRIPSLKAELWELYRRFFSSAFIFYKIKDYCWWKCKCYRLCSGIRLLDLSKLVINWKYNNDVKICWYDVITTFFWRGFISLIKFTYWSKFYVNIITGSGVITIFSYKRLTRNPEIGNTAVWVLPNIWRLGQVRDTKFGMDVSNKMVVKAAKYQDYSFYCFWVNKGKPTGGKISYPQPRLGLKKKGLELVSLTHFCIIFEINFFSCYILLTEQILFSGCFYFVRYWAICVLQLMLTRL